MTYNNPSNQAVVEVLSLLNDAMMVPAEETLCDSISPPETAAVASSAANESALVTPSKQTNKENVTPQHETTSSSKYVVSPDSIADLVSALGL